MEQSTFIPIFSSETFSFLPQLQENLIDMRQSLLTLDVSSPWYCFPAASRIPAARRLQFVARYCRMKFVMAKPSDMLPKR